MKEFLKATVDLADIVGLYLVISKAMIGKGEIRFLASGLGWATADLLATRLFPLWVGARGVEFDWKYIQMSLESNINLVSTIMYLPEIKILPYMRCFAQMKIPAANPLICVTVGAILS